MAGNRVDEAPLLADFLVEARAAPAAENVVHHIGGIEIRVVAGDPGLAEDDDALRHRLPDHLQLAARRHHRRDIRGRTGSRQRAERLVEPPGELGRRDVARDADDQPLADQAVADEAPQILHRDRGDGLRRPGERPGIGMVAEGEPVPGAAGDPPGVVLAAFEPGDDLAADACDRLGIEAGGGERLREQREGAPAMLAQRPERAPEAFDAGIEADRGDDVVERLPERP